MIGHIPNPITRRWVVLSAIMSIGSIRFSKMDGEKAYLVHACIRIGWERRVIHGGVLSTVLPEGLNQSEFKTLNKVERTLVVSSRKLLAVSTDIWPGSSNMGVSSV